MESFAVQLRNPSPNLEFQTIAFMQIPLNCASWWINFSVSLKTHFFACIYMCVVCMHICMSIHMYENIHVFMYMSEGQRFMSDVCFHFSPLILYVEVKSLMWTQCSQIQLIYQTSLLWSSLVSVPQSARTVNGLPAHQPCLWVMGKETQFLMLV